MNTILDINRLGLLLKRYFVENKKRELTFWGIATVIFVLIHLTSSSDKSGLVEVFLYISGLIFAARTFKIFGYTPGGMHFLLIPATHFEKLVSGIILNTFYYFGMMMITYAIGTVFGIVAGNIFFETSNPIQFAFFHFDPNINIAGHAGENLFSKFIAFALIQSVFMVGSLYFKRNAAGQTFLALSVFFIILVIIELLLVKVTFGTYHLNGQMINLSISGDDLFFRTKLVGSIIKYSLIPFFWIVAYFRLIEKQV